MVGADPDRFADLFHRECRATLQEFGQMALVQRIEVQDDDEGQPAVGWNLAEESIQGFQSAGRSADAGDRWGVECDRHLCSLSARSIRVGRMMIGGILATRDHSLQVRCDRDPLSVKRLGSPNASHLASAHSERHE